MLFEGTVDTLEIRCNRNKQLTSTKHPIQIKFTHSNSFEYCFTDYTKQNILIFKTKKSEHNGKRKTLLFEIPMPCLKKFLKTLSNSLILINRINNLGQSSRGPIDILIRSIANIEKSLI